MKGRGDGVTSPTARPAATRSREPRQPHDTLGPLRSTNTPRLCVTQALSGHTWSEACACTPGIQPGSQNRGTPEWFELERTSKPISFRAGHLPLSQAAQSSMQAVSVHTSAHILWDGGIRETPPGARTPLTPPLTAPGMLSPGSRTYRHTQPAPNTPAALPQPPPPPDTGLGAGSTRRLSPGPARCQHIPGILPAGNSGLPQLTSGHSAEPGTGTATSRHPRLGTHRVARHGRSGKEASGAGAAGRVAPPKRRRTRRKGAMPGEAAVTAQPGRELGGCDKAAVIRPL